MIHPHPDVMYFADAVATYPLRTFSSVTTRATKLASLPLSPIAVSGRIEGGGGRGGGGGGRGMISDGGRQPYNATLTTSTASTKFKALHVQVVKEKKGLMLNRYIQ